MSLTDRMLRGRRSGAARQIASRARRDGWGGLLYGAAGGFVLFALLVAVVGPLLAPQDPFAQDLLAINQAPAPAHPLGTDHLGRDVLSRLLMGTRLSLEVGLAGLTIALFVGGLLGLVATAAGGVLEFLVFGFVDLVRTLPGVLLALLLIVALGAGIAPVSIALGLTFAPYFARIARATYRREAAADYVAVARSFGAGRLRVLGRHILPNVAGAFITQAAIILPRCIVTESVLSFFGLGVEPDTPTWGRMIAQASRHFETAPIAVAAPVLALSLLTLSMALIGDWARLHHDPLRRPAREVPR